MGQMMTEQFLVGRRIFVAEDEYLIASDISEALSLLGAEVIGPVPSVEEARELLAREERIDAAVLDINLRGDMVFTVADSLTERGVPVVFATGYDAEALPHRFDNMRRLEKPLQVRALTDALEPLFASMAGGRS